MIDALLGEVAFGGGRRQEFAEPMAVRPPNLTKR